MEYQFTHTLRGVVAKCSMDYEAFAHWLNAEMTSQPENLVTIFKEIEHCHKVYPNYYEAIFEGHEYSLYLTTEEVMVKANNIDMNMSDVETLLSEGIDFYDNENIAFCGLEDFEHFLQAYQRFITTYH